jgi:hypothetical protein
MESLAEYYGAMSIPSCVRRLIEILPPRIGEASTPPLAELQITRLPTATYNWNTGELRIGERTTVVRHGSNDLRRDARKVTRLADAAACDAALLHAVGAFDSNIDAGRSPLQQLRAPMPPWSWTIDAALRDALGACGLSADEVLETAAGRNGGCVTIETSDPTRPRTMILTGAFPLITATLPIRQDLTIRFAKRAELIAGEVFPGTVCSASVGRPLSAVVETQVAQLDRLRISAGRNSANGTRFVLASHLVQLAAPPAEVLDVLPEGARAHFGPPRWGRDPQLLKRALGLLRKSR